jgi:methionyl-tRNA synthetase
MPINQDGHFHLKDLEGRITADLANNLGNLLNRTLTLAINNGLKEVNISGSLEVESAALKEKCEEAFRSFWDEMNHNHYHVALANLWNFISLVNVFFHSQQPWKVAKSNKELFEEIISVVCHSLYSIGVLLWPVMPKKMEELLKHLGHSFDLKNNYEEELRKNIWNKKFVLEKGKEPLFVRPESKIEKESSEEPVENKKVEKTEEINIEEFAKVHLHVGQILECEPLEGSIKLYKMQIDFGKLGKRQIMAGVAKFFKPEELIGKQGVYVLNLKPRKLLGEESQGMMLFAEDDKGNMQMTTVADKVENGTRLS